MVQGETYGCRTTADILPDDVLLEIFDLCQTVPFFRSFGIRRVWKWHLLAHVCRRWRQIIFESPHRLNVKILCTHETPVRKDIHIWPTFPIVIDCRHFDSEGSIGPEGEDNVIAALGHLDRVSYIRLQATNSELERMFTAMHVPFPLLTRLEIVASDDDNAPVLPAGFLGGSAPCLHNFYLSGIPFPTLPTLLLSTINLVRLDLSSIPPTDYISPEAMAMGLAPLIRLENLIISFRSLTLHPDQIHPPPVPRIVLPALSTFTFMGARAYLEDLIAWIDSPQLDRVLINYSYQFFDVPVAQLAKFLDRSMGPNLTLLRHAQVSFFDCFFAFNMYRHPSSIWYISCEGVDLQISNIAESFRQFSTTLSNVAHLKLKVGKEGRQLEGTDDVEWLHLLRQFSAVQSLYVSQDLAGPVALALEDINVDGVLPSLDLIYLEGQPASSVEKFLAARQISGCPVTIVNSSTEFDERLHNHVSDIPDESYVESYLSE